MALSRVKIPDGIALSNPEPNNVLHEPRDERALAESQRLRSLRKRNLQVSSSFNVRFFLIHN